MEIKRIIIHEINKEAGSNVTQYSIYDNLLDVTNKKVIDLVQELNRRYGNKSETYGIFNEDEPTDFHVDFDSYLNSVEKDNEFISFSKKSTINLKKRIELVTSAKGGFIIFVEYFYYKNFFGIFIVRNKLGTKFDSNNTTNNFSISEVQHIDFENLAMACRINYDAYKSTEIQYLSFINKTNRDSDYFTKWISTSSTLNSTENTKILLKIINKINLPFDENGVEIERDEFKNRVYNFINNQPNKMINIFEFSKHFFDDEQYLKKYCEDNDIQINGDVIFPKNRNV